MRQNIYILKKIQWCWSDGNRWKRTKQNIYSIVSLEGNTQKNDVCWDIYNLTTQFWHFEISLIWVSNFDNMYSEMEIQRKQTRSGETEETQFHFLIVLPDAAKKERKYYSDWNPYFLNKTEHSLYCENSWRKIWIKYPEYFPCELIFLGVFLTALLLHVLLWHTILIRFVSSLIFSYFNFRIAFCITYDNGPSFGTKS